MAAISSLGVQKASPPLISVIAPPLIPPSTEPTPGPEIPDNYVSHVLKNTKPLPPITWQNFWTEINWVIFGVLSVTPFLTVYGLCTTRLTLNTAIFSFLYMQMTSLGITAGYHRLWSHRSYNASKPLEYFLALAGAGALQGSIRWWARGHRAHHRYTDTDLDPYGAHHGILWAHMGWLIFKPRRKPGAADVADLNKNQVVRWQQRWYFALTLTIGFVLPTLVTGLGWNDWWGGIFFASAARIVFAHHAAFCVNSIAHKFGEASFDDAHTPRDNFMTAFVTMGEGYHNFHHQFPSDYRNGAYWYQWDPTKWFIIACEKLGLASHLRSFPENEVKKGRLTMELKKLGDIQDTLSWPQDSANLPVISWESFQEQSIERPLVLISGHIHDVSSFMDEHPGGRHLLARNIGRDATTSFFGGVYGHSNAAHNLMAMLRVGVLQGGLKTESERSITLSEKFHILQVEHDKFK